MLHRRALALFCLVPGLLAPAARAADQTVNITGLAFSPRNVTIQVGDTVTWVNNNQGAHNVVANNGSFRSGEPEDQFTFSHTFTTAGSFGYHCQPHQALGMTGTVTVEAGGGGGDTPGKVRFSQASYSAGEAGNKATITVSRIEGDDGAATVQWAAAAGTAAAGADFTAASGTLTWADQDDANKTFQVTILNDTADEPNETVQLTLSAATGAALDDTRKSATLTITDDDDGGGGGTAPSAPTNLTAAPQSTTEIGLTWTDASSNETGFQIERRDGLAGTYQEVGTVGANVTSFAAGGLTSGTFYVFRVRAQNAAGSSIYSNEAGAAPNTLPLPCLASATVLCVNNNRFQVEVDWRTTTPPAGQGQAVAIPTAPDSGLFYFFSASNLEMLLKVLNGCSINNRYWVFFAATTNVEVGVRVTDTQTGTVKSYFNRLGQAVPPIQDTNAFATCP